MGRFFTRVLTRVLGEGNNYKDSVQYYWDGKYTVQYYYSDGKTSYTGFSSRRKSVLFLVAVSKARFKKPFLKGACFLFNMFLFKKRGTLRRSIIVQGRLIPSTGVVLVVLVLVSCSPRDGFLVLVAVVACHYVYYH